MSNGTYDPQSIMHYPIDPSLTLDNIGVPWNRDLSEEDKIFISHMYSFYSPHGEISDSLLANSLFVAGNDLQFREKDLTHAIQKYDKAIELCPNHKDIWVMYGYRAMAKLNSGDQQGCINDVNKAVSLVPTYQTAYYYRAVAEINLSGFQEALNDCNKLIELKNIYGINDISLQWSYNETGYCYYKLGNCQQAILDYDKAAEIGGSGWKPDHEYRTDAAEVCGRK
jgi:tetratricopeptide (TPR) repeat protein